MRLLLHLCSLIPVEGDYVFYSDATIDTGKHYILNTIAIDDSTLDYYGLELFRDKF